MAERVGHTYRFGGFCLDADQGVFALDGEPLKLTPKTFDLVLYFAKNANRTISKQSIIDDVWHEAFVEESNLTVHVSQIRTLLRLSPNSASIETFPKRGYRFTAN